jgi:DNA topoisomerase-2
MKISDFYKKEFLNYSSYDNYRKIACVVDGLKVSARKVIYTLEKCNVKNEIAVDSLMSKTKDTTKYIHGIDSLFGVITGMAQDFAGTNNLTILDKEGNYGSRLNNVPSADRYIYTRFNNNFDLLFRKDDGQILPKQTFSNVEIEYKYYMPLLPMVLVNGTRSLSSGYKTLIYSKNPKNIIKFIKEYITKGSSSADISTPYFRGFTGDIIDNGGNSWSIRGAFEVKNTTTVIVTELPISYTQESYNTVLIKLKKDKKIVSYRDLSDPKTDTFNFEIKFTRDSLKGIPNLYKFLSLEVKDTEIFTLNNENYIIENYDGNHHIMETFIKLRLEYYQKRKNYLIDKYSKEATIAKNKANFIKGIVEEEFVINKLPKGKVEKLLSELKFDKIEDSFDYLLNMNILSLTKEKYEDLLNKYEELLKLVEFYTNKNINEWYLEELSDIEKQIKSMF